MEDRDGSAAFLALDRRSFTPLYHQLLEGLVRQIRRGVLKPGEPLPSERELARSHGVSTITARRVMAELVHAGLAERVSGVGSFVSARAAQTGDAADGRVQ